MPDKDKNCLDEANEEFLPIIPIEMAQEIYTLLNLILEKNHIPAYYYSLGKLIDDCVCIEYIDGSWAVYEGSRGQKINLRLFCSAYEAGCDLFDSIVLGEEKLNTMKDELQSSLKSKSYSKEIEQKNNPNSILLTEKNDCNRCIIKGGIPLAGEVQVSGSRDAALPIISAAILADDSVTLKNLPDISDVNVFLNAIASIGAYVARIDRHTAIINGSKINNTFIAYDQLKNIRCSYYLLSSLLGKYNSSSVPLPSHKSSNTIKPIDQPISGLRALGAEVVIKNSNIFAQCNQLVGSYIYLDNGSVEATISIMLAASHAVGKSIIENASKEPYVVDVANFLNSMGADIKGAGSDIIRIRGVSNFHGCTHSIVPDMIEAGTYMMAAAATKGDIVINKVIPKHLEAISAKLIEIGCEIEDFDNSIRVVATRRLRRTHVKTMPYPGFPTDMQPQMTTVLALSTGTSSVTDDIIQNRFMYVPQLVSMGALIKVEGKTAIIDGIDHLSGAKVSSSDIQDSIALVIAGLAAKGTTVIEDISSIFRGYEDIDIKLRSLGADIIIKNPISMITDQNIDINSVG